MAYSAKVRLPRGTVTALSQAATAISAARFQNSGSCQVKVQATAADAAPDNIDGMIGAIKMDPMDIIGSDITLAVLFPHITTPAYLWAVSNGKGGEMEVVHA